MRTGVPINLLTTVVLPRPKVHCMEGLSNHYLQIPARLGPLFWALTIYLLIERKGSSHPHGPIPLPQYN